MSELKLEPGWLTRDVTRAVKQASGWQSKKSAAAQAEPTPNQNNGDRDNTGGKNQEAK
jgi:hypothetical protein